MWKYRGQFRPEFAEVTGPGQESVWDYPRPPVLSSDTRHIEIRTADVVIASTRDSYRVLETASPPTFYLPAQDVRTGLLTSHPGASVCEWKGAARYWALSATGRTPVMVAWSYPDPPERFEAIRDYYCFYPGRVQCYVDGERVRPQPGEFYGGWVTDELCGPFKGTPGTSHW